jgi:alpha-glucosidase
MDLFAKNYATNNKRYSVIYMHDAQNLLIQNSYAGEWNVDEKLDSLQASYCGRNRTW